MNFHYGGTIDWVETKVDEQGHAYYPQKVYVTQHPHVHDYIGGGGIAFNAWHSCMVRSLIDPMNSNEFFRFTSIAKEDDATDYVEIPDGMPIDNEQILTSQTSLVLPEGFPAAQKPKYLGVWQFIYTPAQIEQRRAEFNA